MRPRIKSLPFSTSSFPRSPSLSRTFPGRSRNQRTTSPILSRTVRANLVTVSPESRILFPKSPTQPMIFPTHSITLATILIRKEKIGPASFRMIGMRNPMIFDATPTMTPARRTRNVRNGLIFSTTPRIAVTNTLNAGTIRVATAELIARNAGSMFSPTVLAKPMIRGRISSPTNRANDATAGTTVVNRNVPSSPTAGTTVLKITPATV